MIYRSACLATLLAAVFLANRPANAFWMPTGADMPVERVVSNVQRYIEQHPKDASGYYVLGRIHSLAWATGTNNVSVIAPGARGNKTELPAFAPFQSVLVREGEEKKLTSETREHLLQSIWYYQAAVRFEPKNALYRLGLAWMAEQAMKYTPGETGRTAEQWKALALEHNRAAYQLVHEADAARTDLGLEADTTVSLEAAQGIVRLISKPTAAQEAEIAEMRQHIATMQKKPRPVTPILVPLAEQNSLNSLLAPQIHVQFDLAGNDRHDTWEWVSPQAGILVWDPNGTGKITSGRQLFGSATWWMLWKDGYRALAALDDNGDGRLRGSELTGLAIWRDANQNGASEPGEVTPLGNWGVESLAVTGAKPAGGGSLVMEDGVRFSSGQVAPTYDWMAQPVR